MRRDSKPGVLASAWVLILSAVACGQTTICQDPHYRNHPLYGKYCSGNSGSASNSSGGSYVNKGGIANQSLLGLPFWILYKIGKPSHTQKSSKSQSDSVASQQAHDLNEQGVTAYLSLNFASAADYFEQALAKTSNDPVILDNLQKTNLALEAQHASEARRAEMARSLDLLAEAVRDQKAVATDPSLTFIGANGNKSGELEFMSGGGASMPAVNTDAMAVDARDVPSGLPKPVEDTLARVFHNASPEAMMRLRKGWQAVMTRDWIVAGALFEDALNHDPNNPQLIQFMTSFRTAMQNPPPAPSPKVAARAAVSSKEDEELKQWWVPSRAGQTLDSDPNWRDQARFNRDQINELYGELFKDMPLPTTAPKPAGRLQVPQSSDMQFLITLPPAASSEAKTKSSPVSQQLKDKHDPGPHN